MVIAASTYGFHRPYGAPLYLTGFRGFAGAHRPAMRQRPTSGPESNDEVSMYIGTTGHRLSAAADYRLPTTGYRLPATGHRLPATFYWHILRAAASLAAAKGQLAMVMNAFTQSPRMLAYLR